ncbi:hypothetical protein PRZ48_005298 [Zasmidium cellare]|uniref:Uncharacterized protein n=1 Tax=Zasmidium cellare TaxID=395010 RepID=A0ABR0ESC4_ZASCE|nr:hypothetical protein PRZ48_005298 [Zasmidium cellare]
MPSANPGVTYFNFANYSDTVGHNSRDTGAFHTEDRVRVRFYDGDYAEGHMGSYFHLKTHKVISLAPGAKLFKPDGTRTSKGLTFKTGIVTSVKRI